MKFVSDRPFANPDAAARQLLDIVRTSIAESGLAWGYTGATNTAFTRAGGSVPEYSAGIAYAAAKQWFRATFRGRGSSCCRMVRSEARRRVDYQSTFFSKRAIARLAKSNLLVLPARKSSTIESSNG